MKEFHMNFAPPWERAPFTVLVINNGRVDSIIAELTNEADAVRVRNEAERGIGETAVAVYFDDATDTVFEVES